MTPQEAEDQVAEDEAFEFASTFGEEPKVTGWDDGLSQDYNKKLGRWFSNRPGARRELIEKQQGEKK